MKKNYRHDTQESAKLTKEEILADLGLVKGGEAGNFEGFQGGNKCHDK